MRHEDSQSMKVLRHLQSGKTITSFEAFAKYHITRLSAVIWILRNDGHDVKRRMVATEDGRESYAEYWMEGVTA